MIVKSQYVIQFQCDSRRGWEDTMNRFDVSESGVTDRLTKTVAYLRNNTVFFGEEYRVIIREINESVVAGL